MLTVHCNEQHKHITYYLIHVLGLFIVAQISILTKTSTTHRSWKACLMTAAPLSWTWVVTRTTAFYYCQYYRRTKATRVLLIQEPVPTIFTWVDICQICIKGICFQVQACKCTCFMFSNASFAGANEASTSIVVLNLLTWASHTIVSLLTFCLKLVGWYKPCWLGNNIIHVSHFFWP